MADWRPHPWLEDWTALEPLGGGEASDSWLAERAGQRVVVRQDRQLARHLGLDRIAEVAWMTAAGDLAPEVCFSDRDAGLLVTAWCNEPSWTPEALGEAPGIDWLGQSLRQLHAIPVDGTPFDAIMTGRRYARAAGVSEDGPEMVRLVEAAACLPGDGPLNLCHHDAHAGNLFGRDRVVFIDWEYSAVGHPLMDLAVICGYHGWDEAQVRHLLDAWSDGEGAHWRADLARFEAVYQALAALWELAVRRHRVGR